MTDEFEDEEVPTYAVDSVGCLPPVDPPESADPRLRQYATERQWECMLAWVETGGFRPAAAALGIDRSTVKGQIQALYRRAAQQGLSPDYDLVHPVPEGMTSRGTSIRYDGDGNVQQYWNKTKPEGMPAEEAVALPDPKVIAKLSTLYDAQGKVQQQWVSERPEDTQRLQAWREAAKAMAEPLPRVDPIPAPATVREDLMVVYPVGDHHLGMLSWPAETGAAWDVKIAERMLMSASEHLMSVTPQSGQALIVFLGDFVHFDGFAAVTPTSRNLLDADSRFPKIVRAAVRSMRNMIEAAAAKHSDVRVIVEIGNHDLSSSIFLMECLNNVYENNPRISIDTSPRFYHYYQFGKTLIGTHHGHEAKADRLPGIMAADEPKAWGETEHRYWLTGHTHHQSVKDFERVTVESFRILAPADAWASQKGYRAKREMKAIVIHREFGEVARHSVTPGMFKEEKVG